MKNLVIVLNVVRVFPIVFLKKLTILEAYLFRRKRMKLNWYTKALTLLSFMGLMAIIFTSCQQLGLEKEKSNNTAAVAVVAASLSRTTTTGSTSCTSSTSTGTTVVNSTATLDASTGCVSGVASCMDSGLPSWIKDNFKCAVGYTSGTNYIFKSQNVPNTKSYYYGSSSPLYDSSTSGNPSSIVSQKLVYTIPSTVSKGTGTDSTQGGLVSIGITVNGLAIYNNAAAPGDTLATEAQSFDAYAGHPEGTGMYHHHTQPTKLSNSDANLIGIILDGYALYGKKCDNGTSSTSDDFQPTDLDSLHGHTKKTIHFSTATYHYHLAYDSTATIDTLMGSYFYGNKGSVSK